MAEKVVVDGSIVFSKRLVRFFICFKSCELQQPSWVHPVTFAVGLMMVCWGCFIVEVAQFGGHGYSKKQPCFR